MWLHLEHMYTYILHLLPNRHLGASHWHRMWFRTVNLNLQLRRKLTNWVTYELAWKVATDGSMLMLHLYSRLALIQIRIVIMNQRTWWMPRYFCNFMLCFTDVQHWLAPIFPMSPNTFSILTKTSSCDWQRWIMCFRLDPMLQKNPKMKHSERSDSKHTTCCPWKNPQSGSSEIPRVRP